MRILLLVYILLCLLSCSPTNILTYRNRPFYKETDSYQLYSDRVILRQSIRYDKPQWNDEEHTFGAVFMIKTDSLLKGKRRFDFTIDSVYYFHQLPKKSFSESRTYYKLIGNIDFLFWDSSKAIVKQNISVIDSFSRVVKKYNGKRRFKRSEGNVKLYFD